ncbi:MAG: hypothetical protein E7034_01955 [Akkermansiaceae bacterium]|nr:hypothetical protein [Akkermansiaceae bacterium]
MATAASALLSGQFDFNREIPERFSGFAPPATECGFFYSESNQLTDFRHKNTLSTQLFQQFCLPNRLLTARIARLHVAAHHLRCFENGTRNQPSQ